MARIGKPIWSPSATCWPGSATPPVRGMSWSAIPAWVKGAQWQAQIEAGLRPGWRGRSAVARHLADAQAIMGIAPCSPPSPAHLRACLADRPDLLAEMARAAVAFHTPHPVWPAGQDPEGLDLKRGGLFPWCTVCGCSPWRRACWKPRPPGADRRPGGPGASAATTAPIWRRPFRLFMRASAAQPVCRGDGRVHVAGLGSPRQDLLRHALHPGEEVPAVAHLALSSEAMGMWAHWRRRWQGGGLPGRGVCPPSLRAPRRQRWVALDFETTSLDPAQAEIVSIGAVRIRGNRIETGDALSLRVQAPPA